MIATLRTALEQTTGRVVELLVTAGDGGQRAVGQWTVGDVAAHLTVAVAFDAYAAYRTPPPAHLADLLAPAQTAQGPGDVAGLNAMALARIAERDPAVLAQGIERESQALSSVAAGDDGTTQVEWLGGAKVRRAAVLAHLLSEMLVHGFDIARALRRRWPVPSDHAAFAFDPFLSDLLRALAALAPSAGNEPSLRPFRCELRPNGVTPILLVSDGRQLTLDEPGGHVDARIGGEPSDLLLVMYRRTNPARSMLRRRLTITGRRPWRIARLASLAP